MSGSRRSSTRPWASSGPSPYDRSWACWRAEPMALQAASVVGELERAGVTHIVWLPDSETGYMYEAMKASRCRIVQVCREGESMAVAAGLIAGGAKPIVLIQSTGLF